MASEPTGFRRWRRTRPFWGAVLAVLAGLELIAIPLAPMGISIHQGMGGVASWLAGAILILSGILVCSQPQQRSFYGVLAVLAALGSFMTSNLGGFLLGMILGLVGGSMIFAWTPRPAQIIDPAPTAPVEDSLETLLAASERRPEPSRRTARHARTGAKAMAAGVLPASLGLHLTTTPPPTPVPTPTPLQSEATPSPKAVSGPAPASTCPQLPSSGAGATQAQVRQLLQAFQAAPPTCLAKLTPAQPKASSTTFEVSTQPATLKADALWMYGMSYDGVVTLPTRTGSIRALKFSMSRATLDGVTQSMGSSSLRTPSLVFNQGVTMYTAKMSGTLLGIPLTLEPGSPLLPLLQALNALHLPAMEMSDIVSEQPTVQAGSATAQALTNTA